MKLRVSVVVLSLVVMAAMAAGSAYAQGPSVAFSSPATVTLQAGKDGKVVLPFRVANGYHINSHKPHEDYLIPTELKLEPPSGVMVAKVEYPDGKDASFPFAPDEKLSVYAGDFNVSVLVHALPKTAPGNYTLKGTLRFQACDNRACYPPKNTPVELQVSIAPVSGTR